MLVAGLYGIVKDANASSENPNMHQRCKQLKVQLVDINCQSPGSSQGGIQEQVKRRADDARQP